MFSDKCPICNTILLKNPLSFVCNNDCYSIELLMNGDFARENIKFKEFEVARYWDGEILFFKKGIIGTIYRTKYDINIYSLNDDKIKKLLALA